MALMPMAMYGLEVPAGDVAIPARPDIPSAFRITMAAIDPSAEPEGEEGVVPRATLKVIRQSLLDDEDDDSDFDQEQMERLLAEEYSDESDEDDDEEVNGGPSDPSKSKKARLEAAKRDVRKMIEEDGMDVDEDDSEDDDDVPNGINGITKSAKALGKLPASDEDEDEDSDDMSDVEVEEYVICTLDPSKVTS
jgi:FK506-binding nuclear protein